MPDVDYYKVLSVGITASKEAIRSQYRILSLKSHPDHGGTTQQMSLLNEAYATLSNGLLRREYTQKLLRKHAEEHSFTTSETYSTTPQPSHTPTRPVYTEEIFDVEEEAPSKSRYFWRAMAGVAVVAAMLWGYSLYSTFLAPSSSIADTPPNPIVTAINNSTAAADASSDTTTSAGIDTTGFVGDASGNSSTTQTTTQTTTTPTATTTQTTPTTSIHHKRTP